jgi:thioredoxin-dependent peroxiredoxin
MTQRFHTLALTALLTLLLTACATTRAIIPVDTRTVQPGETVTRGGTTTLTLLGTPLAVGQKLPSVKLVDRNLKTVDPAAMQGEVLLLSVVPSLDTQVCEQQTHLLGEEGAKKAPGVRLVTISRDLPFAQKRFAEETGFKDILFLSDYQKSDFGQATGLLVDQIYLLARSIILVDRQGTVRYIQVVPELSHLPDMKTAFAKAAELTQEK